MPILEVEGLVKSYGSRKVVDGVSFSVDFEEVVGLLGPNGAGKTTTIHLLVGLLPVTSGRVEVLGMEVPREIDAIKRSIGIVPDESSLFDRLTGLEFLEFGGRMYGLPRDTAVARARELLQLFELESESRDLIAGYSKGMKKRLALAGALIHRPQLFLLDEPFEGVDPVGARLMKRILSEQVAGGATVFLTSHVLEVVERICDQVAIIDHGRVVECGPVAALRRAEETLEDIFMRVVGGERAVQKLDWLG